MSALHPKLQEKLMDVLSNIRINMVARFAVMLPYDEIQSMLMSEDTLLALQTAGRTMGYPHYTNYEYKLGEKVTIKLICRGGKEMPTILFPREELTIFSEDFLDRIRPLYLITKSWMDVTLAFKTVLMLLSDTRELNFFVPWLRLIIPERDLTNHYNAEYRVTQWLNLDREKMSTIALITHQIKQILRNEHTSKRTWMPSELVQMVRQGEELITQYNIMKSVPTPTSNSLTEDSVEVHVVITVKDHPTIKWGAEASVHRTEKEVERMREQDQKRKLKE